MLQLHSKGLAFGRGVKLAKRNYGLRATALIIAVRRKKP